MFGSSTMDDPYLSSLADFNPLPPPGFVSLGEVNDQFEIVESSRLEKFGKGYESVFDRFLENHIPVSNEGYDSSQSRRIPSLIKTTTMDSFLLQQNVNGLKGIWTAWMENGFMGSLEALEKLGLPKKAISLVHLLAAGSLKIRNGKRVMKTFLFPHLKMSNEEMIATYAPVHDWSTSWVRAMCWHTRLPRLALALNDDSVKILVNENPPTLLPILKAPEQKSVSSIAWHPYVTEFALGVESGFIIWTLHPPIKDAFPISKFTSTVQMAHAPITAVDYSRNGDKMLTCSAADTNIFIWNLGTGDKVALYRLSGGGVPRAAFSPNEVTEIFSNTPGNDFRIWEYDNSVLKPKSWKTVKSSVEAFAWHPSGDFLFFVSDSLVFKLTMSFTGDHVIEPVFDLAKVTLPQQMTNKTTSVGGKVVGIEWDPTGKRLVLLFLNSSSIPVLRLLPGKNTSLVPCDFICGQEGEYPVAIAFQKDFQHGALLTIAWSSERLQYFPFLFASLIPSQKGALNSDCRIFSHIPKSLEEEDEINVEKSFVPMSVDGAGDNFKLFYSDKLID